MTLNNASATSDSIDFNSSHFLSKYPRHTMPEGRQIKVGVLGATGTVGQRFITLRLSIPGSSLMPWVHLLDLPASPIQRLQTGSRPRLYPQASEI